MKKTDNTKCSKEADQLELPYTAKGFNHNGKECGSFLKVKQELPISPSHPIPVYLSKKNESI